MPGRAPKQVIRNLITCAHDGGNYLINIGPKPDGSIPEESVQILSTVGRWMDKNGAVALRRRRLSAAPFAQRQLFAPWQHALLPRAFLAGGR